MALISLCVCCWLSGICGKTQLYEVSWNVCHLESKSGRFQTRFTKLTWWTCVELNEHSSFLARVLHSEKIPVYSEMKKIIRILSGVWVRHLENTMYGFKTSEMINCSHFDRILRRYRYIMIKMLPVVKN
jgi:hypothetical protein